jgi:hypothetical protein
MIKLAVRVAVIKTCIEVFITSAIIIYAGFGVAYVHADECEPLFYIADSQWNVLQEAYDTGAEHNLGHTMAAIAWSESRAGKYIVNTKSNDFGVMQNNIKTAAKRRGADQYYQKQALITELVTNTQLSMDLALEELLYWDKHTTSWAHTVSAYNNGWAYEHGKDYLSEIRKSTRLMIDCAQLDQMFNEEKPMDEEAVGDLVQSFNKDTMSLEPKVVGSYTGKLHNGAELAKSRKTATVWESLQTRLSRMWT